jgi:hypothetical protein
LVASDGVTTPSGEGPDEGFWRRPVAIPADAPASAPATGTPAPATPVDRSAAAYPGPPASAAYPGPPSSPPPPPGWRPPVHIQPPLPRQLPDQDVPALEEAERSARTLTYGVGLIAGAVLMVVVFLLCSRVVF